MLGVCPIGNYPQHIDMIDNNISTFPHNNLLGGNRRGAVVCVSLVPQSDVRGCGGERNWVPRMEWFLYDTARHTGVF
jgi:hypothetical protein